MYMTHFLQGKNSKHIIHKKAVKFNKLNASYNYIMPQIAKGCWMSTYTKLA